MSAAGHDPGPQWDDPTRPYHAPMPDKSPAAIRAELPAELRTRFEAEFQAALIEATKTYRLDRLEAVVRSWWLTVWANRKAGMEDAHEQGRRWLAGEPVATFPYEPGRR